MKIQIVLFSLLIALAARADEVVPAPAPLTADSPLPAVTRPPVLSTGSRKNREKDAEGTEAPDRFEADTSIKSQYKLHGESLEVDPD